MTLTDVKAGWSTHCRDDRHATCRGLGVPGCQCICHPPVTEPVVVEPVGPLPRPRRPKPTPAPAARRLRSWPSAPLFTTRDSCPICASKRDELGRLPIGFCGPDCTARRARDERLGMA